MSDVDQLGVAGDLLDHAQADGHEFDLTATDLLDYMGILGVSFTPGTEASSAYMSALSSS